MSSNPDAGWVQAGDAVRPLIVRLAALRGATPGQCRVGLVEGDAAGADAASAGTVGCGGNDRQSGKVPLATQPV